MDEPGVTRDAAAAAAAAAAADRAPDISTTREHKTALITATSIYAVDDRFPYHPLEALNPAVLERGRGVARERSDKGEEWVGGREGCGG